MEILPPARILEYSADIGALKTGRRFLSTVILAFLAGAFIAFGAEGSTMAASGLLSAPETYGLGRALAGAVFGVGLMLVLTAGGELFTGNCLIITGVLAKKTPVSKMLANWLIVYLGNFAGGLCIAWLMYVSGLFSAGGDLVGGVTLRIAEGKTALSFWPAFVQGLLCNWLVCLAVWVSFASKEIPGKLLACFFVIFLFVTSGFEHCIANMYYVPAGIFAKTNEAWAAASGLSSARLEGLNWAAFFVKNLLPVTLGNIAGGSGMVGGLYWLGLNVKE
ncbi:MAG: formate/nitrite transporter family protein [Treponema sp.]|jgi:formate/nitrite transporter|nr:formate/nitrite transporter family protein [Treponema sp.]